MTTKKRSSTSRRPPKSESRSPKTATARRQPATVIYANPDEFHHSNFGAWISPAAAHAHATLASEQAITDLEHEVKKEVVKLREEMKARRNAIDKVKQRADMEREAAHLQQRLEELSRAEALSYVVSRVHQDAGHAIISSERLQRMFRNEGAHDSYVMSVDIRRSTELMLKARSPQLFAKFITGLCNLLREIVVAHHGVFDKFTGDGVLAFFPVFFTGDDAGLRAVHAAADCHTVFAAHYARHRSTFLTVPKNAGLGVGIDFGATHFVQLGDALTVVGTPVVYACRLSGGPPGSTLLNQPAFEAIYGRHHPYCEISETEFNVKHEGPVVAYDVKPNGRRFAFPAPGWKSFAPGGSARDE